MSLWEKWEKEKLKNQGIKVERKDYDVKIYDIHPKVDIRKQVWIVLGTVAVCFMLVYIALILQAVTSGRHWSDTYIVRLFVERGQQREAVSQSQR